jgi:hypothetical protein
MEHAPRRSFGRYLRQRKGGKLELDKAKLALEAKLDGVLAQGAVAATRPAVERPGPNVCCVTEAQGRPACYPLRVRGAG